MYIRSWWGAARKAPASLSFSGWSKVPPPRLIYFHRRVGNGRGGGNKQFSGHFFFFLLLVFLFWMIALAIHREFIVPPTRQRYSFANQWKEPLFFWVDDLVTLELYPPLLSNWWMSGYQLRSRRHRDSRNKSNNDAGRWILYVQSIGMPNRYPSVCCTTAGCWCVCVCVCAMLPRITAEMWETGSK